MRRRVARIQFDGKFELALGALPVPVIDRLDGRQNRVTLSQTRIESSDLFAAARAFSYACFGSTYRYQPRENQLSASPAYASASARIFLDRLIEILD